MSDYLERAQEARERVAGLEYEERWNEDRYDRDNERGAETMTITERLEYLRGELRAQRISYGELAELQGLAEHIEEGDVELLEAAGVPEFSE